MPPCRRPSWLWRACVPENGRDGRLDMGVEISGSRNVSADERVAWELTAAPVPVGIGTYVRLGRELIFQIHGSQKNLPRARR